MSDILSVELPHPSAGERASAEAMLKKVQGVLPFVFVSS